MEIFLVILLFAATEAHFLKTPLRLSSEFFGGNELFKGKLLQKVFNVKLDTDFCFEMDHKHYCGVADELVAMNDQFRHFTNGDVVFAAKYVNFDEGDADDIMRILDDLNDSQRDYINQEAHKQGHDVDMLLETGEFFYLIIEIACHGEFEGELFPQPHGLDLEIEIHINARQNSPFCKKKEKIPTGGACQTGYRMPEEYLTTFPIPFGFDAVCENPAETCIKTNGNEDLGRGICAPESQKVGCGNGCPEDEYCAMTSSTDVARGKFAPQTAHELTWPAPPFNNLVTVICPFRGNVLRWSKQPLVAPPPYRRYDTPFCTCKKRLAEGSECQYSFDRHGNTRLDFVVVPKFSYPDGFPQPNENLNTQRIDVGCAQNQVCKRQQSGLSTPRIGVGRDYGICRPRDQN